MALRCRFLAAAAPVAVLLGVILTNVAAAECGVPRKVWEAPIGRLSVMAQVGDTVYAGVDGDLHVVQEGDAPGPEVALPEGERLDYIVGGTSTRLYYLTRGGTLYAIEFPEGTTREIATGFEILPSSTTPPSFSVGLAYGFLDDVLYYRLPRSGLWKTGGGLVGSVLVQAFAEGDYPGFTDISPFAIQGWDDGIIFTAITEETGFEPWWSDGTTAGTRLIADVVPAPEADPQPAWLHSSLPTSYHIEGEYAYFWSGGEQTVWRTDGTAEGTVALPGFKSGGVVHLGGAQIGAGAGQLLRLNMDGGEVEVLYDHTVNYGPDVVVGNVTRLGGRVIYSVYATGDVPAGNVWVSDGTSTGTYPLYLTGQFLTAAYDDRYRNVFLVHDDTAYFFAWTSLRGAEFWKTDGTLVGTSRLTDINPGPEDSVNFNPLTGAGGSGQMVGDAYYFEGGDSTGDYLWVLDLEQGPEAAHSADTNADYALSLSELLRLVQFFNSGGYHVAEENEDGFAPGPGNTDGAPHDSDYDPQDWAISLSEILRAVQFYNAPTGAYCVLEGTEDGFAV